MVGFYSRDGACVPVGLDACPSPKPAHSSRMRPAPFASLSASLASTLGEASSTGARREPRTGMEYPLEFCYNTKAGGCPSLLGLGVRSKVLLGIKNIDVYTVGVYVDDVAAKKVLAPKHKSLDTQTLADSSELIQGLLESDRIEKTLRLVIAFGSLRRPQFVKALEERLAPALLKEGDSEALQAFKDQFDDITIYKGLEISFTQLGQELVTQVGGKKVGTIKSPALNKALWDIYLGEDPASKEAKSSLGSTLARVVKS